MARYRSKSSRPRRGSRTSYRTGRSTYRARRAPARRRRTGSSGGRTIRIVIQQQPASAGPITPMGMKSAPAARKAKF